jgi:hypothetical protein
MSENGQPAGQRIKIQDEMFDVPSPYVAGHQLLENEAGALNQLLAENLRNNFAAKVKAAKEEAAKNGTTIDLPTLQAELDTYAKDYQFGTRRASGAGDASLPKDPVLRQAHIMAREQIREKAKSLNRKVDAETVNKMVPGFLEKMPGVMEEARRRVEAMQSISIAELDFPEETAEESASEAPAEAGGEATAEAEADAPRKARRR